MNHRQTTSRQTDRRWHRLKPVVQTRETRFRPFKAQTGSQNVLQPLQACVYICGINQAVNRLRNNTSTPPTNPTQLNTAQQLQFTSVLHTIIKAKFWVLLSQFGSSAEKTFYPPTKQGTLRRVLSSFSRNLGSFSDWKGIYIVQLILHSQSLLDDVQCFLSCSREKWQK